MSEDISPNGHAMPVRTELVDTAETVAAIGKSLVMLRRSYRHRNNRVDAQFYKLERTLAKINRRLTRLERQVEADADADITYEVESNVCYPDAFRR